VVIIVIVIGYCFSCCPFLTCPLCLHWLVVISHSVPPPHRPTILVDSSSAAASQKTAASVLHLPVVCQGCVASNHAAASLCANASCLPPLVVDMLPLSVLMCYHLLMRRHLPLAWLVVAWLLIALQPLDAPPPFNVPSGCQIASHCAILSSALAGCSTTSMIILVF
jgi:hypothetical protein